MLNNHIPGQPQPRPLKQAAVRLDDRPSTFTQLANILLVGTLMFVGGGREALRCTEASVVCSVLESKSFTSIGVCGSLRPGNYCHRVLNASSV